MGEDSREVQETGEKDKQDENNEKGFNGRRKMDMSKE